MKKLLMLCYYFPPLGMGGVQRPAKFAKYLQLYGWQPTVVTVEPIAYWAQDPELLRELNSIRIIRTESYDPQRLWQKYRPAIPSASVVRVEAPSSARRVLEQTMAFWLMPDSKILWKRPLLARIQRLLQEESFDALYTTSPPHSVHLIGRRIARRTGLKWVADFRDSWAGGVVVREPTRVHRRWNRWLQRAVLKQADAVLTVSQGIADQLKDSFARSEKIHLIPNGFDPEDFPSSQAADPFFTFCHCGSITRFSDPRVVLQALERIRRKTPAVYERIRLLFVGLDVTGKLSQQVADLGLADHVCHCGYQNHREALQRLMNSQALLLVARGADNAHFIPGKTWEYLASGKPILALTDVPDTADVLLKSGAARLCAPDDPVECAEAMSALAQNQHSWFKPQNDFINRYNRRRQTEQLAAVLDAL
ncbi:MAG TPA: glycosyltransferase family 4 protein [bacterium]|nr:glycosyltransferase family 4 protein [bacterium]HPN33569.1 glycosyltransferase family 4 protein [bacterium]